MKPILNLLLYYVSYTRFIGWLAGIGALAITFSTISLFFEVDNEVPLILASVGMILLYGLPAFVLFVPFRELISSERLALAPNLKLYAGIALFLFTVLGSSYLPLMIALLETEGKAVKVAFNFYFFSCVYQYFVHKSLASRYFIYLITLGPTLLIAPLVAFRDSISLILYQPQTMFLLALATIPAWFIFFNKLRRKIIFKPINTNFPGSNKGAADPFQNAWPKRNVFVHCFSYTGTLLSGQPDGKMATLIRSVYLVYLIPFLAALIIGLTSLFNNDDLPAETLVNIFLLMSAVLICFTPVFYSEFAPRCRMLWLRFGSNRQAQWQLLESVMWRSQIFVIGLSMFNTLLLMATPYPAIGFILNYPLFIIVLTVINMYFGLYSRINKWPQVARVLFTMIANMLVISFVIHLVKTDASQESLYILAALLSFLAFILRQGAISGFTNIDWLQVKLLQTKRFS